MSYFETFKLKKTEAVKKKNEIHFNKKLNKTYMSLSKHKIQGRSFSKGSA